MVNYAFAHPLVIDRDRRMSGLLDDAFRKLQESVKISSQSAIDKFKNQVVATAATSLLKDPVVQNALIEEGKESAAQQLATSILQSTEAATQYVKQNKNTFLVVGGVAAAALVLYLVMRK